MPQTSIFIYDHYGSPATSFSTTVTTKCRERRKVQLLPARPRGKSCKAGNRATQQPPPQTTKTQIVTESIQIIAVPRGIHVAFAGNKEESGKTPLTHYHTTNYTQSKSNQHVPGITDIGQDTVRHDMTWYSKARKNIGRGTVRYGTARQGTAIFEEEICG